jgi:hypothetical protein
VDHPALEAGGEHLGLRQLIQRRLEQVASRSRFGQKRSTRVEGTLCRVASTMTQGNQMMGDRSASTFSAAKRGISAGSTKLAWAIWCIRPGPLKVRSTSMASSAVRTAASPAQWILTAMPRFSQSASTRASCGTDKAVPPRQQQPYTGSSL